jgi:hypothetical protein
MATNIQRSLRLYYNSNTRKCIILEKREKREILDDNTINLHTESRPMYVSRKYHQRKFSVTIVV